MNSKFDLGEIVHVPMKVKKILSNNEGTFYTLVIDDCTEDVRIDWVEEDLLRKNEEVENEYIGSCCAVGFDQYDA